MNTKPTARIVTTLSLAGFLAAVAGCDALTIPGITGDPTGMKTLTLNFSGLEALGDAHVYEGWLIADGAPNSTGRFTIDADGMPSQTTFDVDADVAEAATTFVLTIEPAENDPPEPADTHVLAGDFDATNMASLTIGHGAALGDDFTTASGSYLLNTPSSADDDDDYDQGIWWLQMVDGLMMPALDLPDLPAGWVYEGWVVGDEGPISTGRFTAIDMEDDDGAGETAGPDGYPAFPGQDFVDPAMPLIGYVAVISVEPDPDDSSAPFAIKPLMDTDIEDLGIGVSQDMTNVSDNAPSGTADLDR